jgi:hypothetical protein
VKTISNSTESTVPTLKYDPVSGQIAFLNMLEDYFFSTPEHYAPGQYLDYRNVAWYSCYLDIIAGISTFSVIIGFSNYPPKSSVSGAGSGAGMSI